MFIVYLIIIFIILVFVHELGHFLFARIGGIGVNEFAIGMGPKLISKQRGETLFSLRAVPFGGFCSMVGEDEESEEPKAFNNRPVWARLLTLVAGSTFNIIFAAIILMIIIFSQGEPFTEIEKVESGSPAYIAGIEKGDTIVSINDTPVKKWIDVNTTISQIITDEVGSEKPTEINRNTDFTIEMKIKRADGTEDTITTPLYINENAEYMLGLTAVSKRTPLFALQSIGYGAEATWNMTKMMYEALGKLITGKGSLDDLGGVVMIADTVKDSAERGFLYVVQLTALLSLNLGIINLLPFPALDGGRIVFLIVRQITGKRISDSFEGGFHLVGFVLLIGFMLFITVRDVQKIFF